MARHGDRMNEPRPRALKRRAVPSGDGDAPRVKRAVRNERPAAVAEGGAERKATWRASSGDFGLPRLSRETLNDRVYTEVKRAIMSGGITPGARISMRELSRSIGTSMMPVRGAMQRLSAERTLEMLPNRSFVLPVLTAETFRQIREIRVTLEGRATEAAAVGLSPAELDTIKALGRRVAAWHDLDIADYMDLHQEFHFAIYRGARSEVLLSILETLWLQIRPQLIQIMSLSRYELCDTYHDAVLHALERKDGAAAREAIERDIMDAAERILEHMEAEEARDLRSGRGAE